jgi:hypothetical protein
MFPSALPPWTPRPVIEKLLGHLRFKLLKEIDSMNLMKDLEESGGRQSTDSNQSLGSITSSVVSGTSVTSGGHIEDNDDGERLTIFKRALDSFSRFFFGQQ